MATTAEKRQALKDAGYEVGTRGRLSAEAEEKYAELTAAGPVAEPVQPEARNLEV